MCCCECDGNSHHHDQNYVLSSTYLKGLTDYYTKTEIDALVIDPDDYYTKTEVDALVSPMSAFSAYKSGSSVNVTGDGTVYYVVNDIVEFNIGGDYNNSDGAYHVSEDGVYIFAANCYMYGLLNNTQIEMGVRVSPKNYRLSDESWHAGMSWLNRSGSIHLELTAGDLVRLYVMVAGGAKTVNLDGSGYTRFSGHRVS